MDHPDIAVVATSERPPLPASTAIAGEKRGRDDIDSCTLAGSGGAEDEMAEMLGFSGFGAQKKR